MSQQAGIANLLGLATAADPELAAAQLAQQHAGSLIMGVLVVLGIILVVLSLGASSFTKAPHTKAYIAAGLGGVLIVIGGIGIAVAESHKR